MRARRPRPLSGPVTGGVAGGAVTALRLLTNRFLGLYFCCLPARFASQRKGDADRAPARWPARKAPLPGAEALFRILPPKPVSAHAAHFRPRHGSKCSEVIEYNTMPNTHFLQPEPKHTSASHSRYRRVRALNEPMSEQLQKTGYETETETEQFLETEYETDILPTGINCAFVRRQKLVSLPT